MRQYLDMLRLVRENGVFKSDRTGTGTYSIFAHQMRFDLSAGFPLVTTKKTHLKSIIHELLWFLKGETNIRYLKENGVNIWDDWVLSGTAEYRELTMKERSVMVSKKGEEALDKWTDHIREVRGDFLEGMADLTDEITEKHHQFLDTLDIPRQVLMAGELGPVYGSQWRSWPDMIHVEHALDDRSMKDITGLGYEIVACAESAVTYRRTIDQIANLIEQLKTNPDSRRLIVSAWNPALVDDMALPPCHCLFQFYTAPLTSYERKQMLDKKLECGEARFWNSDEEHFDEYLDKMGIPSRRLSCQLYQRSMDVFLGCPFNIASYALLTMMIAQVVNMVPGEFIHTSGDTHLYANHLEQADLQLTREPLPLPTMRLNPKVTSIFDFTFEDFELVGYESHPHIAAPIAV